MTVVTVIVGWIDKHGAWLCCDSAVGSNVQRSPSTPTSSFGELQDVDGKPVEEAALKIFPISALEVFPKGEEIAIGITCDDLHAAMTTLKRVFTDPRTQEGHVKVVCAELAPQITGAENKHELLLAHVNPVPTLSVLSTNRGFTTTTDTSVTTSIVLGSLPEHMRDIVRATLHKLRESIPDEPRTVLMSMLVLLQSLGIGNYLPQYGVGGAFFGLQLDRNGDVVWQDELCYYLHPQALAQDDPEAERNDIARIRCRVRDSVGIVTSSLGEPGVVTVLVPPGYRDPINRGQRAVASDHNPGSWSVPTRYVGLLDTHGRKAICVVRESTVSTGLLDIRYQDGVAEMILKGELLRLMTEPLPDNIAWRTVVARETSPQGLGFAVIDLKHRS